MLRKSVLLMLCCLAAGAIALGRQQTIKLKNGMEMTGDVEKTPDGYRIKTASGVVTVIRADMVASIEDMASPQEEYEKQKAKTEIDPKDPSKGHYSLARWAYRKGYLEIAKKELQEALSLKPDYELAQLLLKQVERQMNKPAGPVRGPEGGPTVTPVQPTEMPLMGRIDINRIRLGELREDDDVALAFAGDVVAEFIKDYRGVGLFAQPDGEREFMSYRPMQKAIYILRNVDRENFDIKDKIIIRSDPKFMLDFRQNVWPLVARYCAGSGCHGGAKPLGGLQLFKIGGSKEELDYTNFFILESYEKGGLDMVDRGNPDKSLLLQYGLTRKLAEFRHPKEIPPAFSDTTDRKYVLLRDWIRSLAIPRPVYGVKYKPPGRDEAAAEEQPPAPPAEVPAEGLEP